MNISEEADFGIIFQGTEGRGLVIARKGRFMEFKMKCKAKDLQLKNKPKNTFFERENKYILEDLGIDGIS